MKGVVVGVVVVKGTVLVVPGEGVLGGRGRHIVSVGRVPGISDSRSKNVKRFVVTTFSSVRRTP